MAKYSKLTELAWEYNDEIVALRGPLAQSEKDWTPKVEAYEEKIRKRIIPKVAKCLIILQIKKQGRDASKNFTSLDL